MVASSDSVTMVELPAVMSILTSPLVGLNVWEVHGAKLSSIVLKSGVPKSLIALIWKVAGKSDVVWVH